ncbi:MAG: TrkH family potassium uptake protein, partial [Erysipelothrix sp.]|nr:TrkH family potassium uptake protein [Erysipelothrix sp.]
MKFGAVSKYVGSILIVGAFLISPALILAFVNQEAALPAFGITFFIMLATGLLLSKVIFRESIKTIRIKEGLAIVTFSWVFLALFGALPFYLSGVTSTYIDAIFETVSGLTTTGASIITDVEVLDQSILFWRSFTHWIGGMGILVFTIALLPAFGIGNFTMFKAESPGPTHGRITPHIKSTARTLYLTYFALTIVQIIFLMLGKVNALDASLLTFGTVGTGGFAILNDSIASYSSYVQIIIAIFMVASGVNFTLYVLLFQGKLKEVWADAELRLYLKILGVAVVLIMLNLVITHHASIIIALKDAFFQVASIMTT